jgi:hypothetical protein
MSSFKNCSNMACPWSNMISLIIPNYESPAPRSCLLEKSSIKSNLQIIIGWFLPSFPLLSRLVILFSVGFQELWNVSRDLIAHLVNWLYSFTIIYLLHSVRTIRPPSIVISFICTSALHSQIAWKTSCPEPNWASFSHKSSIWTLCHTAQANIHLNRRCPTSSSSLRHIGHFVSSSNLFESILLFIGRLLCASLQAKILTLFGHCSSQILCQRKTELIIGWWTVVPLLGPGATWSLSIHTLYHTKNTLVVIMSGNEVIHTIK